MLRVGLTGGLATGKSLVAAEFARLGACVIYADRLGHELLAGEAKPAVLARFGPEMLDGAGRIDRQRLGARVFQDPAALADLNSIIHPLVWREEERMMAECAARGPGAVGIVEAAILIETGSHARFDQLVLTVCDPETQIARAMARDGATREQVLDRLARQWPLERKLPYAHHVVDTSGTIEVTLQRTRAVWESLRSINR